MLSARGSASPAISWMVGVSLKGCHSSIKNGIQVWQQFNRKTQPDWNDCTAVSDDIYDPSQPKKLNALWLSFEHVYERFNAVFWLLEKKGFELWIIEVGSKKREGLFATYW